MKNKYCKSGKRSLSMADTAFVPSGCMNQSLRASPMTYMFDGKQYLAIAPGANVLAFALSE